MTRKTHVGWAAGLVAILALSVPSLAQNSPAAATPIGQSQVVPPAPTPPPDYIIGVNDVLSIVFWRDDSMTQDVVVRPDGRISLPLINDVDAIGLTPEQLRLKITDLATKFVQDPSVSVVVKQINSRLVYITGNVGKGGPYNLMQPTTVLQLIAMAGGLGEWAEEDKIVILRTENGKPVRFRFNYKHVLEGRNPQQNIELKPGDTVLVP
jgi:polysaccharide export outer membrane protein